MSRLPVVAVVGRPNVGKSTLVNRIIGRRAAVVEEQPGVTRDRTSHEAEWQGRKFLVVDTGGWEVRGDELASGIRAQAEAAVAGADVVLFVADARTTVTEDDVAVARLIQRSGAPHVLVANKVDGPNQEADAERLWNLGLGAPVSTSALTGRNTGDLLERVVSLLPPPGDEDVIEQEPYPTLAIIGRPNVGKSTLLNRLAGSERVLVSPSPGTTRDAVDEVVELDGTRYALVDTAGIRRPARVESGTEFFSVVRARRALQRADVVLLVVDAVAGVTHQEQRLAEEIATAGAGLIVLLNKWDAVSEDERLATEDGVADRLAFVGWAPVLRLSALTGARLHRLGAAVEMVLANRQRRIPTAELNRAIRRWQQAHPAPLRRGKRPRVVFAVQAGEAPPTFVLFMRSGQPEADYLRFLENRLRDRYDFTGTPLHLVARVRSPSSTHV